tara:strand:- start:2914 stop:3927 length:1014 start_codon:yes stop_codon:yes gene_type:complete
MILKKYIREKISLLSEVRGQMLVDDETVDLIRKAVIGLKCINRNVRLNPQAYIDLAGVNRKFDIFDFNFDNEKNSDQVSVDEAKNKIEKEIQLLGIKILSSIKEIKTDDIVNDQQRPGRKKLTITLPNLDNNVIKRITIIDADEKEDGGGANASYSSPEEFYDIDDSNSLKNYYLFYSLIKFYGIVGYGGKNSFSEDFMSLNDIKEYLLDKNSRLSRTVRHELVHYIQDYNSILRTMSVGKKVSFGDPFKRYSGTHQNVENATFKDYALDDKEFYAQLTDKASQFKSMYDESERTNQNFRDYIKDDIFFKELKKHDKKRWHKFAGELYKAIHNKNIN